MIVDNTSEKSKPSENPDRRHHLVDLAHPMVAEGASTPSPFKTVSTASCARWESLLAQGVADLILFRLPLRSMTNWTVAGLRWNHTPPHDVVHTANGYQAALDVAKW